MKNKLFNLFAILLIGALCVSPAQAMLTKQASEHAIMEAEKNVTSRRILRRIAAPLSAAASVYTAIALSITALTCPQDTCSDDARTTMRAFAVTFATIPAVYNSYKLRQKYKQIRREMEHIEREKKKLAVMREHTGSVTMVTTAEVENEVAAEQALKVSDAAISVSVQR